MELEDLDELEELIWRYRKHLKIINRIKEIDENKIGNEDILLWQDQIHNTFIEKIQSKL